MTNDPPIDASTRVAIVRTRVPGNVGAVARAIGNFGGELWLVAPRCDHLASEARQRAARAEPVLHAARVVATLDEALLGVGAAAGTSARVGGLIRKAIPPREALPPLLQRDPARPFALVFGPEDTGLENDEIAACDALISIPTTAAYPALNLSQAVGICLYELTLARQSLSPAPPEADPEPVAPKAERDQMLKMLEDALAGIGFLRPEKKQALSLAISRLVTRARPTQAEVNILRGVARQTNWFLARRPTKEG